MQDLTYHAPRSLQEACEILGRHAGAKLLAGGTDLVPQLREGRASAHHVVDIKRVPDVCQFSRRADGAWRIGAAATIGALGRNPEFAAAHPALLATARLIGSLQIQNRASLGGNLCNAAPSADAVPLLICMGAIAEIVGPRGIRRVPVGEIATGPGRTSLAADDLLVAIELPASRPRSAATYQRFTPRREMDIAVAGVAAGITLDPSGRVVEARIALASVAPTVMTADAAAQALIGEQPTSQVIMTVAAEAARESRPISDARASAEYRRQLVQALTQRVLADVFELLGAAT